MLTSRHKIIHIVYLAVTLSLLSLTSSSEVLALQSRDQIRIVGSSTVFPFSTTVAETYGRNGMGKTPIVESTGSGGGFKLFCSGLGLSLPDITMASRQIKASEIKRCADNNVTDIVEFKIGYDGIVFASSKNSPPLKLTLRDIYLALAKEVPAPGTEGGLDHLIANPYTHWNQINKDLPAMPIKVLGPPPTSGTRDALNELGLEGGCISYAGNKSLKDNNQNLYQIKCHSIREDGVYQEQGENDNLVVQKLIVDKMSVGIFGFSFLDQNSDLVQGAPISSDGKNYSNPSYDNIADANYPVSRSLYLYVKKGHVGIVPGLVDFMQEFMSESAIGEEGYLNDRGLIPLVDEELQKNKDLVESLNKPESQRFTAS